jgi:predicted ATP pyrophosphatase (TIGR00289 family)
VIAKLAGMEYVEIPTHGRKEEELADLKGGLARLPVTGIVTGAVASVYQNERVAAVADALLLEVFSPLWQADAEALLLEVAEKLDAIIVVTAADGLDAGFLGARIDHALIGRLKKVAAKHRINLAGEGGEYESLTLSAPFYSRRLSYASSTIRTAGGRSELVLGGFF